MTKNRKKTGELGNAVFMGFSCKNDNVNMNKLKEIKGEAYSCLGSDSSCQRDKKLSIMPVLGSSKDKLVVRVFGMTC